MRLDLICPYCAYQMDAATGVGPTAPGKPCPGAVSICISCGRPSLFAEGPSGLALRAATSEEYGELLREPTVISVMTAHLVAFGPQGEGGGKNGA